MINDYNHAIERMSRAAMLQDIRRREGYYGAAKFYQFEAARWHKRAMKARADWTGETWAGDLADAVMLSWDRPRFEPAPYAPPADANRFNSDLYAYELPTDPNLIAWGTKTITPDMVISAAPNQAFASAVVATINRDGATDAICTCGTLFERCTYPDCNARCYANR